MAAGLNDVLHYVGWNRALRRIDGRELIEFAQFQCERRPAVWHNLRHVTMLHTDFPKCSALIEFPPGFNES